MRRLREALAIAAMLTFATAAGARADVRLQSIGPRFDAPVHVAGAPGDGERLYVVEQGGLVKVVRGGTATVFADITRQVLFDGEQGLLSIAFPPDFQTSRLFYVYYTNRAGDDEVDELRAPTGDAADPASRRVVLPVSHPSAGNHNGGQLQFGPDGYLYLAPGDGGTGGANAHDRSNLLGKVLRIDPRNGVAGSYTIPADNPYAGQSGVRGEIWAEGLRNPFRFSFDRSTGDLVVGDVGESTTEEIDWLPAGSSRGADFGWNRCEGSFVTGSTSAPCTAAGTVRPILDLPHAQRYASVIPGYVVRDPSLPSLFGRLVYGDYFVPALRSAVPGNARATDLPVGVSVPSLTSFGEDAGGCVYVTSAGGTVSRLVETDTRIPCAPATPPPVAPAPVPLPPPTVPAGGGSTPRTPGAAVRRPRVSASAGGAQRVLRNGAVVLHARCAVACRVTAAGTLTIGRRGYELRRTTRAAKAGQRVRLVVRLTRGARAALRRAVRAGRSPRVALRVRAEDAAGTTSLLARASVRVKR